MRPVWTRPAPLQEGGGNSELRFYSFRTGSDATPQLPARCSPSGLTVHGHAHGDALLEAAQLTLVAGDLVDDAAAIVLARVGRVEVLLDGPAEETLRENQRVIVARQQCGSM